MQESFVHEKKDSLSVAEYVFNKESREYINISGDSNEELSSITMNRGENDVKVGISGAQKVSKDIIDLQLDDTNKTPGGSKLEGAVGVASAQYDDEYEEPGRSVLI